MREHIFISKPIDLRRVNFTALLRAQRRLLQRCQANA